jgi:hypothetical protein
MSQKKKEVRQAFRDACYARDGHRYVMCGRAGVELNAHHIEDRHAFPNGGYVPENGITLCAEGGPDVNCHWKAERSHSTGVPHPGYSPEELYALIGSSLEQAIEADARLSSRTGD